jgi:hypothetical protein
MLSANSRIVLPVGENLTDFAYLGFSQTHHPIHPRIPTSPFRKNKKSVKRIIRSVAPTVVDEPKKKVSETLIIATLIEIPLIYCP